MITIKRRIVQHGNTSLTVSLPIKWAKKFNLKKGDEIDVEETNNTIVISTDKSFKISEKDVQTSKLDTQSLKWLLSALYKRGYDQVNINFSKPEHIQVIQERVNQLLGYAIIEQTHNNCVIKNISEALEGEFDSTLKRAFLLTMSMGESGYEIFKNGDDVKNLSNLINIEETNNQLTVFCHRVINKKGYKDYQKTNFVYVLVWILESIADDFRDIYKIFVSKGNSKVSKESIELFKDVNQLVRLYYNSFYDFSFSKIMEIVALKKEIINKSNKILMTKSGDDAILVKYLASVAQRVSDSVGSLLAMNA